MKIKKSVLADALKVLGKVVSQTSPVKVQRSVRFLGVGEQVWLTARPTVWNPSRSKWLAMPGTWRISRSNIRLCVS